MSRETLRAVMDVADEGWVHDIEAAGRVAYDHARALLAVADAAAAQLNWVHDERVTRDDGVVDLRCDCGGCKGLRAALAALEALP